MPKTKQPFYAKAPEAKKILVGLSGGVDSAVALYLLQQQGYQVEAAFMKNFSDKVNIKGECPWIKDREEAYRVAAKLKVPIQTFDFQKEYSEKVIDYIFESYQAGMTPNPDILCNNEIKFKLFLEKALKLGFDKIATGHYARIIEDKHGFHLLRGQDSNKDQSYFLAGLTQSQLAKALFPIGDLEKTEVRKIAKQAKLPNADRKDSQGICFIGKVDLKTFLQQKIKPQKGNIVDTEGNKLAEHEGVWYYTIGQRKGLDIGGGGPWYVVSKNLKKNEIVVGHIDDEKLYNKSIQITDTHWLGKKYKLPLKAKAQIRYRQPGQDVTIYQSELDSASPIVATFKKAQKGVASGQILAVYDKDELIASAKII
jgi:tRNA-specific 2-thiouridylase